jgi:DNA replicative helicase MCM subunit Mcm2 (Cdc46/Mcm family)
MRQPPISGIRSPVPGDKAFFVCKKCGHRFMAKINFLSLPPKCPKCGSRNVGRDPAIVH